VHTPLISSALLLKNSAFTVALSHCISDLATPVLFSQHLPVSAHCPGSPIYQGHCGAESCGSSLLMPHTNFPKSNLGGTCPSGPAWPQPPGCFLCLPMCLCPWFTWPQSFQVLLSLYGVLAAKTKEP
jgi:hypothetical protein